jgi:hypothetical protein
MILAALYLQFTPVSLQQVILAAANVGTIVETKGPVEAYV